MALFTLTIACDNASFCEGAEDSEEMRRPMIAAELSVILMSLARRLAPLSADGGNVYDSNGNRVG